MQTWRFTMIEDHDKIARLKEATIQTAKEHKVHCYGFENPAVFSEWQEKLFAV